MVGMSATLSSGELIRAMAKTISSDQTLASLAGSIERYPSAERRHERRQTCEPIPALVRIDSLSSAAQVLDISLSGLRLRIDSCLPAGTGITVSFNSTIAIGNIRYCRPNQDHSFDAGVQIEDVLNIV